LRLGIGTENQIAGINWFRVRCHGGFHSLQISAALQQAGMDKREIRKRGMVRQQKEYQRK
jgi:hypothetical protein